MTHRVVFEIEVDADGKNPEVAAFEAARTVRDWLRNPNTEWQFYVQPCDKSEDVFSVDLSEEDEDAVQKTDNYIPMIK